MLGMEVIAHMAEGEMVAMEATVLPEVAQEVPDLAERGMMEEMDIRDHKR